MPQAKVGSFAQKVHEVGGNILFDPQMFYPKEEHIKLQAYDYWPSEGCSIASADTHASINRELLRINNSIGTSQITLPGIEMKEDLFEYNLEWLNSSVEFFGQKTDKDLFATLCLYPETIRNTVAIENLVEVLRVFPVAGYYIILHLSNNEYIVSDPMWVIGMMKLISCLKLSKRKVIVGCSNHQGLVYALAHADAIASGTYMNTRLFVPGKFKSPKDDDVKHKSTQYYIPTAFTKYKAALLDVAMQRGYLDAFAPQGDYRNRYSDMLFNGAMPSSANYNETNSFKHYLHCLKMQCGLLSRDSYDDVYNTYEFMLGVADNQIKDFKRRDMTGQNLDFAPAIETNRIVMCANDEDYGLRLKLDWDKM